jgi:hypothetical protein
LIRENFPVECAPGGMHELQVLCAHCHSKKTRIERAEKRERG